MEPMQYLEISVIKLINSDRFYAELLMRMKKTITKEIPTAGVRLTLTGVELLVNPYFMKQHTPLEFSEILKHECEHILREHIQRSHVLEPEVYKSNQGTILDQLKAVSTHKLLNMAQDYSINETLKLKDTWILLDNEGKEILDDQGKPVIASPCLVPSLQKQYPNLKIKRNQSMDYYYTILKQVAKEGKQPTVIYMDKNGNMKGAGQGNPGDDYVIVVTVDSHDELSESLKELDPELAKEITKKLANDALEATPSHQRGSMSSDVLLAIDKLNSNHKDWRKEMRQFRTSCTNPHQEDTRKKRNRRYGLQYPGKRSVTKVHIAAIIDSSGSMTDEILTQMCTEIHAMQKLGINITLIECDAAVKYAETYNPKHKIKIIGRGGTAFAPAFEYVETAKFKKDFGKIDGLIYLTDGENFDTNAVKEPKYPVLWALLPGCKVSYNWGKRTIIEMKK